MDFNVLNVNHRVISGRNITEISVFTFNASVLISLFPFMGFPRGWDVAQLAEHRTGTPPTQVRFPGAARNLSPRVNFQRRLSYGVRTPPCAMACINIYAHVEDPVVHVRVRWIMETVNHPACTVGLVARLRRSWLSPGKSSRNFL